MPSGPWNARRAVLADAGPLYAAADLGDQYHERAQRELQRLVDLGFDVVVVRPTLLEAHSLLLRRLGARRALAWLDEVLPSVFVADPNPDDFDAAVERLRLFPDQSLSIFDAVLAVVSERTGVPVWTFDHHFDVMRAGLALARACGASFGPGRFAAMKHTLLAPSAAIATGNDKRRGKCRASAVHPRS